MNNLTGTIIVTIILKIIGLPISRNGIFSSDNDNLTSDSLAGRLGHTSLWNAYNEGQ